MIDKNIFYYEYITNQRKFIFEIYFIFIEKKSNIPWESIKRLIDIFSLRAVKHI